jgi:hypothetical protein
MSDCPVHVPVAASVVHDHGLLTIAGAIHGGGQTPYEPATPSNPAAHLELGLRQIGALGFDLSRAPATAAVRPFDRIHAGGSALRGVRPRSLRRNPLVDHGDHC